VTASASRTTVQASAVDVSTDERALRIQLAATYRLAEKFGMSEIINTHISLRVPGPTPTFLINPQGLLFDEITASSLVRVDLAGNIVGHGDYQPVNRAGVNIHGAVLDARPDVNCVVHTHTPQSVAVSALQCGLLPLSQAAMRFVGDIAYHDYGRAVADPAECSRLAEDLGDKRVMLMRNHGTLTTGRTVGEAFMAAYYLDRACQIQIAAQSTGQPLVIPAEETSASVVAPAGSEDRAWAALVRRLERQDPSYRD
jgi:ribulose-5-phosphate 4-epimerase/fuculose-1-phosphate aldolase